MEMGRAVSSYPGFKFSPTEEELVVYYLRRKIQGFQKCVDVICEIDITKYEPWDLPEKSIIPSNNEWYFFCARGRKYPKGLQNKRATDSGYWKVTGKERDVKSGTRVVGTKRTLVFHKGRAPKGKRTEWILHEYCMSGTPQESFVVCRLGRNCEYNSSDVPPNEMNQSLTGETTTCTLVDDIQQKIQLNGHTDDDVENKDMFPPDRCYNPHSTDRFDSDSKHDKKQPSLIFQHSTECFHYKSECDKKPGPGHLYNQDESCSAPKFQGCEAVSDNYFDDILNDDIINLDRSSLLLSDLPVNDILNDDYMGFEFEQPNESSPPPTLPFQGTAPRRIRFKSYQRIRTANPLPFQETAPRRIRIKWQHIENPESPEEASCVKDEMYCVVADSADFPRHFISTMSDVTVHHRRVIVLVVFLLLVVFLAAPLHDLLAQRHHC